MTTLPDSWKPQQHLAGIVNQHGSGDATPPVRWLLEYGLRKQLEKEKAARAAEGKELREYAYVSEAGRCPRQLYFAMSNTPQSEKLTLDSWIALNLGKKTEEIYIALLEAAGVSIVTQERIEFEWDSEKIAGKIDLILEIPENLRREIPGLDPVELWELKSMNARAMGYLLKEGRPKDPHLKQTNAYLHGAAQNKIPRPTQAKARLVYCTTNASKGEPAVAAWFVTYDRQAAENDLKILGQAMKDARAGIDPGIPDKYRSRPTFPCHYCSWETHCHSHPGLPR